MINIDIKQQLISYLLDQTDWVTAKTIAAYLGVSVRSFKYNVTELNKEHEGLIISSNKGYKIDRQKAASLNHVSANVISVPRNFEERKRNVYILLLLDGQRPTIDELAEQLCVSPSTLQNELSQMRAELSEYHLSIRTHNKIVSILGTSDDKQKFILNLIEEEANNSHVSADLINEMFNNVDLIEIEQLVKSILNENEYYLDDYSLFNYVLHLAVSIEFAIQNQGQVKRDSPPSTEKDAIANLNSPHVQKIINEIYLKLKERYNITYSLSDIYQTSVLMMTRITPCDINSISYNQIESFLGKDVSNLIEEIITSVNNTYCIDLRNESLLIGFAFHLKNLLGRLEHNIEFTNVQFRNIKNSYPLIYVIAVHISNIIHNYTGYYLSENEISYIALHVGMLIEANNAINNKINTILVCSDYANLGIQLGEKISSIFSDSLIVSNVVTSISDDTDLSNVGLILSTEPLKCPIQIRHYVVKPFLTQEDMNNIFTIINDIKSNTREKNFRDKITYFFHEDLFFTNEDFTDYTDAIEKICDTMIALNYAEPDYKEDIYAHEKISFSSYGKIAIPHPLNNNANTSVIAVSLNEKPIHWGINNVNIVFMLSLREEDSNLFTDIFDLITHILQDENALNSMLKIKTFDDFINFLISYC